MVQRFSLRFRLNALTGDPMIEVRVQEAQLGSPKLYERDASFLNETSNKSFGTTQSVRSSPDIQQWTNDVFGSR